MKAGKILTINKIYAFQPFQCNSIAFDLIFTLIINHTLGYQITIRLSKSGHMIRYN